jgi:protein O-GlcNAc transferase
MFDWFKKKSAVPSSPETEVEALKGSGDAYLGSGDWKQAAQCYRRLLELQPQRVDARINLGYAMTAQGQHAEAEQQLRQAIEIDSSAADAFYLLGTVCRAQGRPDEAVAQLRRAIDLNADFQIVYQELAQTLIQLGQAGAARDVLAQAAARYGDWALPRYLEGMLHMQAGELESALQCFESAIGREPDFAEALLNGGNALAGLRRHEQAVDWYGRLLVLQPGHAQALCNHGCALQVLGRLDQAIADYRAALAIAPDFVDAHGNLGSALQARGDWPGAEQSYRAMLMLAPGSIDARIGLGVAQQAQGKINDAISCYREALALDPRSEQACLNLGSAYQAQRQFEQAADCCRQALALNPGSVAASFNLGSVLQAQGKLEQAAESYRRALALQPDYADAWFNLATLHQARDDFESAHDAACKALSLRPDFHEARGNLLHIMSFHTGSSPAQYADEARRYGAALSARANPYRSWNAGKADRLRVGMVSGDLRIHPVGFFLENVLAHLDPERIELIAYVTQPNEDELTARIKPRFAAWRSIFGCDDAAAARMIHDDGVQILIDLAGHTAHSRLPIFAWKPAPLQISWLGYWASTGVAEIDYVLADPVTVPPSDEAQFTEQTWRLPHTRFCFTPPSGAGPVAPLPALRNGYPTFGSFQSISKVDGAALELWSRVLTKLPSARLRMQSWQLDQTDAKQRLLLRLERAGIDASRVTLCGPVPRADYLAQYAEVDIILDTFPFPGGTTTCEALYMGVPTVTLAGSTMMSRQGAGLLTCAGLEGWIASDHDDFVAIALAQASHPDRLADLRAVLRAQVLASPLFDAPLFARNLEQALYGMWQRRQ